MVTSSACTPAAKAVAGTRHPARTARTARTGQRTHAVRRGACTSPLYTKNREPSTLLGHRVAAQERHARREVQSARESRRIVVGRQLHPPVRAALETPR